ncbi:arf-GAP with SH3 domain, ANK repeat and PH domain-containing protein 1-like [Plodia interpunctella]|uniref:arf-GAP with SH3 domain, ANK repeat and PH domain-containing protein 1-like n=1 Tax=Plodia interpunctella TaxID=58824 RepID=UPI0023682914|nr:arf-GAP with SH3 domain, ANK repeat and PH domain-containing protein 1-like [Plodia interpunctella]
MSSASFSTQLIKMKGVIISCLVVVALAEPPRSRAELPRFRQARFRSQRQELAPTTTDSPTEPTTEPSGPYPPSGWKPSGEPFTLPKQEVENTYGAPEEGPYPPSGWKPQGQQFSLPNEPPATSYGVPDNTYGAPTTDAATTDNPQAEKLDEPVEVQQSVGTYYVLLPNGQLQKVEFMTENDIQNMQYTARLQLRKPAPLLLFRP